MTMKKELIGMMFGSVLTLALVPMMSGCLTSKTTTVSGGVTNTVVTVNQAALTLDTTAASVATTLAVTTVLDQTHNDPGVINALKIAQQSLTGVLNGASSQNVTNIIGALKAQNNPVLAQEIDNLIAAVSQAEQQALVKYGASTGGQIALAFAKAVNSGLMVGLQGH